MQTAPYYLSLCIHTYLPTCVCERERERERDVIVRRMWMWCVVEIEYSG